jgi:DUF1680 family protein
MITPSCAAALPALACVFALAATAAAADPSAAASAPSSPAAGAAGAARDYPIRPVPFTQVKVTDEFWSPRLATNRTATIPYDFKKCEETGRISNFAKAAKLMKGKHEGIFFNDSDVYKVVEGASYSLAIHPDPNLDKYLDDLIAKFAAAQEPDGYLYTARTIDPNHPAPGAGSKRWELLPSAHELYNMGHMIEGAVAHWQATGKRSFLEVAIKCGDLLDRVFGPSGNHGVAGHEEIEIALVKLYRATGNDKYLKLAKFFLDQRGNAAGHKLYGDFCQDHKPLLQQTEAVGHCVRAGYLYSGMADVAALTGSAEYVRAIERIWQDVVGTKLYLTGGIGLHGHGEGFGKPYDLPNEASYSETCASIANAMWNHRMFLLSGDGKYMDVAERTIYNGMLAGVSLSGDRFFYTNLLYSNGKHQRSLWFDCSCCPSNVVRFVPSLPGYAYGVGGDCLYVALYVAGQATVKMPAGDVRLSVQTRYPWDGSVKIAVDPAATAGAGEFELCLRIPGWASGQVVPSDLYAFVPAPAAAGAASPAAAPAATAKVNGQAVAARMDKGFAHVRRKWSAGDIVELTLPMEVRRVLANEKVAADVGLVAIQRGPLVYCAEGVDNPGGLRNVVLGDDVALTPEQRKDLLGGVTVLVGKAASLRQAEDGKGTVREDRPIVLLPYYAWAHRAAGEMAVWLARTDAAARPAPLPTLASRSRPSASHSNPADGVGALNDRAEPKSSDDQNLPRHTWWDHKGTAEWVQYDLPAPTRVSAVEVYWFDDTGHGGCRVPASWRCVYREGKEWKPVATDAAGGVEKNKFNRLTFQPVTTDGLRIEVQLQKGFSGGVLEWKAE